MKALVSSITGSPDTCGTAILSMLNTADLEQIEFVLVSRNAHFKYEAIMKVLLNQDHAIMQRKESLLDSEFSNACQRHTVIIDLPVWQRQR